MAEEFVDLYEVIDLPIDADRSQVRKRVNELYLEAQRNLDHRDFKTRVRFQELFEITLPQARYILLDEGRRDDYDRIVRGMRAAKSGGGAPTPTQNAAPTSGGFKIEGDNALPGQSTLEPIPAAAPIDPAQLAAERDELWKKWKSGLEEALQREKEEENAPKTRTAQSSPVQTAPPVTQRPAPKPKAAVKFNFDPEPTPEQQAEAQRPLREGESRVDPQDRERRLKEQRIAITKDLLQTEALKGAAIGVAAVAVPGLAIVIVGMRRLYPPGGPNMIALSEGLAWAIGLMFVAVAAFFTAQSLSKSFRKKRAQQLSLLSTEELIKLAG